MSSRRRLDPGEERRFRKYYRKRIRKFIETFLKIQTKDQKLVPLRLNEAQKYFLRIVMEVMSQNKPVRLVVLKARQMGISTFIEAFLFTMAMLNPDTNCLIVSHSRDSSKRIYRMSEVFLDNLPPEIRPMVSSRTQNLVRFENPDDQSRVDNPGLRSQIQIGTAKNLDLGASFTLHAVHASEVARKGWADPETTMLSITNAVPYLPGTFIAVESTAQGMGGYFYELWQRAMSGKSEWVPVFIPWFIVKEYEMELSEEERGAMLSSLTEEEKYLMSEFSPVMTLEKLAWRRKTIDIECQGKISLFQQEYPSTPEAAFLASGSMVFDPEALTYHSKFVRDGRRGRLIRGTNRNKIGFVEDPSGPLVVFRPPQKGESYVIGADPSEGIAKKRDGGAGDNAAAVVLSNRMEQCAELCGTLDPYEFGDYLDMLGRFFNTALIYPEVSGYGGGFAVTHFLKESYPRLGIWRYWDKVGVAYSESVGFRPDGKSVPILIAKMVREVHRSAGMLLPGDMSDKIEDNKPDEYKISHFQRERHKRKFKLRILSRPLLNEMIGYIVRDNGSIGASGSGKDDRVRALGLAILALEQIPPPENVDPLMKQLAKIPDPGYDSGGLSLDVAERSGYPSWIM